MGASSRQRNFYFFTGFIFTLNWFFSPLVWPGMSAEPQAWGRTSVAAWRIGSDVKRDLLVNEIVWVEERAKEETSLWVRAVSLETLQCLWVRPSPHLPRGLGSSSGDKAQPCWEVPERKCSTSLPFHRWRNQGRTVQQLFTKDLPCAGTVLSARGIAVSETDD